MLARQEQNRKQGGRSRRRGVVLLIVLGLLAMFTLIGVAFVMLTGHAQRGAKAFAERDRHDGDPEKDLNQAFLQVVRGSTAPGSVIGPHSLLEDLYGESTKGYIAGGANNVADVAGGQLLNINAANIPDPARHVGCVLTMRNGPAEGKSTRIVGYNYDTTTPILQIVTIPGITSSELNNFLNPPSPNPSQDINILINGVPFSGTGFGHQTHPAGYTGPLLDWSIPLYTRPDGTTEGLGLVALLPNPTNREYLQWLSEGPDGVEGNADDDPMANEDYDAVDYQNMLLAIQLPENSNSGITVPIPSLHRPELTRYWLNHFGFTPNDNNDESEWRGAFHSLTPPSGITSLSNEAWRALKRKICLRPLQQDHPGFTGSNEKFNAAWKGQYFDADGDNLCDYSWDVDNDGDGVADSIWVDVGLPVRATADGRQYKPLVAILCVDLDGRLNLNAHGTIAQTQANYYGNAMTDASYPFAGTNPTAATLPRGQGYGTAEVNLLPLFIDPLNPANIYRDQYENLLCGLPDDTSTTVEEYLDGRYGESRAYRGTVSAEGYPGPGLSGALDLLSVNQHFALPISFDVGVASRFNNDPTSTRAWATLPDLKGTLALGLDPRGQPLLPPGSAAHQSVLLPDLTIPATSANPYLNIATNDPYELDLSGRMPSGVGSVSGAADHPFGPTELERLLRPYDIDATRLPDRLTRLAPALTNRRHELTTESWDLPCPAVAVDPNDPTERAMTLMELLRKQLEANGLSGAALDEAIQDMLPKEILAGLKMDLNRPFGNGRDDNGNGVVDEPGEDENLSTWLRDRAGNALASIDFDEDGDPNTPNAQMARQLYARHLYVMMLTLMNYKVENPSLPTENEKNISRKVAQWAVNVVDFCDRDSIMTAFEYDVNPFHDANNDGTTWDVDGIIATAGPPPVTSADDSEVYRGLVWGCERPELLITETLAFHDRRTEDLAIETPDPDGSDPGTVEEGKDEDFDQRFKPQGSLFVELYNPWTNLESPPGEFYTNGGVDLSKQFVAGSPVWRLTIVEASPKIHPDDTSNTIPIEDADPDDRNRVERTVYFVGDSLSIPADGDLQYQPTDAMAARIAPILPGRYAVIGPGEKNDTTQSTTYISMKTSQTDGDGSTRRIELSPSINPTTQQVRVFSNGTVDDLNGRPINPATAVVINSPNRLSVSEPTTVPAYPNLSADNNTAYSETNGYLPPYDIPLDKEGELWNRDLDDNALVKEIRLKNNDTFEGVFILHLQRLANPLMQYNKDTNPYLTIDSMPVDLTSFNGLTSKKDKDEEGTKSAIDFFARERGEHNEPNDGDKPNLWKQEVHTLSAKSNPNSTPRASTGHYFDNALHHTLGYLNHDFGNPQSFSTVYMGISDMDAPFPWLTWNNRPFISQYELMQVPGERSSQLLKNFELAKGNNIKDVYENIDQIPPANERWPFHHLINFFYGKEKAQPTDPKPAPNWKLYRLMDFVHVPSRFAGTAMQLDPATFASAIGHRFHPPFHWLSRYREPGRVNINTVFGKDVWAGAVNFFPNMDTTAIDPWKWQEMKWSRRGYGRVNTNDLTIDPDFPTRFRKPFRSAASVNLVPLDSLMPEDEVDATLLRRGEDGNALFVHESTNPYDHTDRNPYFRYQGLQKLGNMVTTRSNVYAVWITVGYFEVSPAPATIPGTPPQIDRSIYPDGYQLGRELGSDTGETERHRAFYLLDRSRPVGFHRGEDLNVEDAVLIKRMIE